MAPFLSLLALFALTLSTTVLASPHLPRNAYNHVRRPVPMPEPVADPINVPVARRARSLNKRCISHPNATSSAVPTNLPTSSVLINVAPIPSSAPPSSPPASPSSPPPPPPTTQAPSPTSTPPPPSSSSSAPAPAQTPSSSDSGEPSYLVGQQSGQGTYYSTGLGACGITNNDSQHIAAVSHLLFDSYPGYDGVNPNSNPVCQKTVTATYQGKSVTVAITDRCTACAITDLDFSPSAFNTLADPSLGRININWEWD